MIINLTSPAVILPIGHSCVRFESWKHTLTSNGKIWAHKMTPTLDSLLFPLSHVAYGDVLWSVRSFLKKS